MSWCDDALGLLERFAARAPLPRVRALHLPPPPDPCSERGEFCALELDDGSLGLAYVLLGDTLSALRQGEGLAIAGADALALAYGVRDADVGRRTVGFAALNALTRCLYDRAGFVPPASADSFGGLDPQAGETIAMIGHFAPLLARIVARGARVLVIELRPELVRDDGSVRVTLDAGELARCDKVLATGTLLLNDTLDRMLGLCRGASRVALVGPSVGAPPDPLYARGVTLLGGTWIHDGPAFADALQRGTATSAFARKYSLAASDYPGWSVLLGRL
jgi:uncharacterized protein (DUF4213/DUF364 family)